MLSPKICLLFSDGLMVGLHHQGIGRWFENERAKMGRKLEWVADVR